MYFPLYQLALHVFQSLIRLFLYFFSPFDSVLSTNPPLYSNSLFLYNCWNLLCKTLVIMTLSFLSNHWNGTSRNNHLDSPLQYGGMLVQEKWKTSENSEERVVMFGGRIDMLMEGVESELMLAGWAVSWGSGEEGLWWARERHAGPGLEGNKKTVANRSSVSAWTCITQLAHPLYSS